MNNQIRTITLKCPSCGATLDVSPDMERFSCGYCGIEQIVQRRGGAVSLKLITDAISRVQTGTDRTAAELALVRLQQELALVDAKLAQPHTCVPPQPHKESNYIVVWFLSGFLGLFVGLWFYVAESYKSLTVIIVVWLMFGIRVFADDSRIRTANEKKYESEVETHVATLKTEREHILAQISANRVVVQHSSELGF